MTKPGATRITGAEISRILGYRQKTFRQKCVVLGWGRFTVILMLEKHK